MTIDWGPAQARHFVEGLEFAAPPSGRRLRGRPSFGMTDNEPAIPAVTQAALDQTAKAALVVGSSVVAFADGVGPQARNDIVNCSLLAQLHANKQVPGGDEIMAWYEVYFDTLSKIGWVLQGKGFNTYAETGNDFEAHEAIIALAAQVFGPAATAVAVITATLSAMKRASANAPWMTIFRRDTQRANAARFQVTLAEPAGGSDRAFRVAALAFDLQAEASLTQVLFFRFRQSEARLRARSGEVTINEDVLSSVRATIEGKLAAHAQRYIASLEI